MISLLEYIFIILWHVNSTGEGSQLCNNSPPIMLEEKKRKYRLAAEACHAFFLLFICLIMMLSGIKILPA